MSLNLPELTPKAETAIMKKEDGFYYSVIIFGPFLSPGDAEVTIKTEGIEGPSESN